MSFSEGFDIGYLKIFADRKEDIFLSITPNMQYGPGIQRDGLTPPKMTDPHTVPFVVGKNIELKNKRDFPPTTKAFVQRAGTWTLFNHVKNFYDTYNDDFTIIGVQSYGDLTMNPWHVALILQNNVPILYYLNTDGDPTSIQEKVHERTYRCLVKWKEGKKDYRYEFLDLQFRKMPSGYEACLVTDSENNYTAKDIYITDDIEFAMSGKPIIRKGRDISLSSVIDQFQDIRHIFNVPKIPARDIRGEYKFDINFGEYILFHSLNARRGALASPIIIDLQIEDKDIYVDFKEIKNTLLNKYHYRISPDSPTRRGEFRQYSEKSVEIFYPHNVYPFGVIGGGPGRIVCLASGGLSGRVGNTLEGIIRIMYDFFGCEDALVLDEGYDTFHILNPNPKEKIDDPDNYKYSNQEVLDQIASFTLWRLNKDLNESIEEEAKKIDEDKYKLGPDLRKWPLNIEVFRELTKYCEERKISEKPPSELDVMAVEPRRSQMRATMIFAVKKG